VAINGGEAVEKGLSAALPESFVIAAHSKCASFLTIQAPCIQTFLNSLKINEERGF